MIDTCNQEKSNHMAVYSLLKGRIGNILFEIAAGATLADKLGVSFFGVYHYSGQKYVSQYENILLKKINFTSEIPVVYFHYIESDFSYKEITVPTGQDIVLDGFFQSEKYFNASLVRDIFIFDVSFTAEVKERYSQVLKLDPISINVRRGDYLSQPKQHPVCELSYFKKAISIMGEGHTYLITSDDMSWCKKKFKGENFYFTEGVGANGDLILQSLCSKHIVSNSSFSWWGAWLNGSKKKTVIAPTPWFGIKYNKFDTKDLLPESWIIIKRKICIGIYFKRDYLNILMKNFTNRLHN